MAKAPNLNELARGFAQRLATVPKSPNPAVKPGQQIATAAVPRVRKPLSEGEAKPDEAALRDGEAGTTDESPQGLSDLIDSQPVDIQRQAEGFVEKVISANGPAQGRGGLALAETAAGRCPKRETEKRRAEGRLVDDAGASVGYPQICDDTRTGRKN